jgi:integrase
VQSLCIISENEISVFFLVGGVRYPKLPLLQQCFDVIEDTGDISKLKMMAKQAFKSSLSEPRSSTNDSRFKTSRHCFKQYTGVAKALARKVLARSAPVSTEPFAKGSRSKSTAESFISNTWLVSCAASGSRFACVSPDSVAAYHGALSSSPPLFGACLRNGPFVISDSCQSNTSKTDNAQTEFLSAPPEQQNLNTLQLTFFRTQLMSYKEWRVTGLDRKSVNWMKKATQILWDCTNGIISKATLDAVRDTALLKYSCFYSKRKVLNFAKGFLRFLTKTTFDTKYLPFELFLEMPKALKTRKHVTNRIVIKEDVKNVLGAIQQANDEGRVDDCHYLNCKALIFFGAFTGQRPLATIARLTVKQFREAVNMKKPVLDVLPEQDKIRMQHYCPLHPQVVEEILPVLDGRRDDEPIFEQLSFQQWLRYNEVQLLRSNVRIVNGDLRKFCEQMGDICQWDQSNKNYILTHGVSGVDWRFYKHPLPDSVYDVYMKYWEKVSFDDFNPQR